MMDDDDDNSDQQNTQIAPDTEEKDSFGDANRANSPSPERIVEEEGEEEEEKEEEEYEDNKEQEAVVGDETGSQAARAADVEVSKSVLKKVTHPRGSYQVLSKTEEKGDLEGWVREERLTEHGRRYPVFTSKDGRYTESRKQAVRIATGVDGDTSTHRPRGSASGQTHKAVATHTGAIPAYKKRSASSSISPEEKRLRGSVIARQPKARRSVNPNPEDDDPPEVVDNNPARSYSGPPVPEMGRVPAGDHLPGWTVGRAEALDHSQFLLYYNPEGEAVGTHGSALFFTGQLQIPRTQEDLFRRTVLDSQKHTDLLNRKLPISKNLQPRMTGVAEERKWQQGELCGVIESLFGEKARAHYDARPPIATPHSDIGRKVVVLDLYCGIGGLSLGLRASGFPHVFGVDAAGSAVGAFRANKCGSGSLEQYITPAAVDQWVDGLTAAGLAGPEAQCELVLVAAPPCQPYSQAGAHKGGSDARGSGLTTVTMLVERLRPLMVVIENVPDMVQPKYDSHVQPLLARIRDAGYHINPHKYECDRHRVAQKRLRLIVSALRKADGFGETTGPLRELVPDSSRERPPTARDALDSKEHARIWKGSTPKDRLLTLGTINARLRMRSEADVTGLVTSFEPSPTVVTTGFSEHSYNRLVAIPEDVPHDKLRYKHLRSLFRREVLLLQSFPPGFTLYGDIRTQSTAVGNAVPPLFAYDLGIGMLAKLAECTGSRLLRETTPAQAKACAEGLKAKLVEHVSVIPPKQQPTQVSMHKHKPSSSRATPDAGLGEGIVEDS